MNPSLTELAEKAQQAARMTTEDIRDLHRVACTADPMAEILIFDLIAEAQQVADRLQRIVGALKAGAA